jgi:hypothetical protein
LRTLYSLAGLLYLGNLIFAIFNAVKFAFPTKRDIHVKMFYVLAMVVSLSFFAYCVFLAVHPKNDNLIYGNNYYGDRKL